MLLGLAPQTTNLNKSENNESGIKNQKPNGNVCVYQRIDFIISSTIVLLYCSVQALVVASSLSNPISVYRELRRQFKALKPFDRLRISFDDETTLKDRKSINNVINNVTNNVTNNVILQEAISLSLFPAYALPTKSRLEQWTQLELRHSSPAFHFTGIPGNF